VLQLRAIKTEESIVEEFINAPSLNMLTAEEYFLFARRIYFPHINEGDIRPERR
jgi:hypothetical protein